MEQPPKGWTTDVKLKRIVDGDTIVVSIEREIIIRLQDIDTPETYRPQSQAEKEHGLSAKNYLEYLLKGSELVIHIPASEMGQMKDITSIGGRIQGRLFANGMDVTEKLKQEGFEKRDDYSKKTGQ